MRPDMHEIGERDVASWPLANGDTLKLRICHKTGEFLDLRRWYKDAGGCFIVRVVY